VCFLLYASHNVLDSLCVDTGPPFGVPLLWPFSMQVYQSPWLLLPDVHHTNKALFSLHNVLLVARELLVFVPLVVLLQIRHGASWNRFAGATWFFGSWFLLAVCMSVASVN
jgi:hypothetical protein